MGDFDETVEARRAERRNQLRPIEVRDPVRYPQDSAGVEIEIMQSATTGTTLDMSRREVIDLHAKIGAYLGEPVRHLMGDDLLNACGLTTTGTLHVTPVLGDVTCPGCRTLSVERALVYSTIGDIAEGLERMKAAGMTRASVLYAVGRVFWEEADEEQRQRAVVEGLARAGREDTP